MRLAQAVDFHRTPVAALDAVEVGTEAAGIHPPTAEGEFAMREFARPGPHTCAQYGTPGPVAGIVGRFEARAGVVRDLVARKPRGPAALDQQFEHLGREIVARTSQLPALVGQRKGGAAFDREFVDREMFGAKTQGTFEIALEGRQGLARAGENEIERKVLEPGRTRRVQAFPALGGFVGAAEFFERDVVKALDAEGNAVDAEFSKRRQPTAFEGAGIDFESDLDFAVLCAFRALRALRIRSGKRSARRGEQPG